MFWNHFLMSPYHFLTEFPPSGLAGQHPHQTTTNSKPKPYSSSRRIRVNANVPEPLLPSMPSWKLSPLRSAAFQASLFNKALQQQSSSTTSPSCSSSFSIPPSSSSLPASSCSPSSFVSTGTRNQEESLKEFLWQHIEMIFSGSVNDNIGRRGVEPIFVVRWCFVVSSFCKALLSKILKIDCLNWHLVASGAY